MGSGPTSNPRASIGPKGSPTTMTIPAGTRDQAGATEIARLPGSQTLPSNAADPRTFQLNYTFRIPCLQYIPDDLDTFILDAIQSLHSSVISPALHYTIDTIDRMYHEKFCDTICKGGLYNNSLPGLKQIPDTMLHSLTGTYRFVSILIASCSNGEAAESPANAVR